MVSILDKIFIATTMTAKYIRLPKYGNGYVLFAIFISLSSILLLTLWETGHFGYALYFGHNVSSINSTQSTSFFPRQIAATENGSVYLVWVNKNNIYSTSSQDNGTKFSTPILLSNGNKVASSPQIAATKNGNVYVVWVDKNSTNGDSDIKFRSSNDSGKSFHDSKKLTKQNDTLSSSPQIAATKNGNVYVVWVDKNNIYSTSSQDNGTKFSTPILLSNGNKLASPQIAATEKGNVYVVWVDKNRIYSTSSQDNGTKFSPPLPLSGRSKLASSPQIAATEKGNVYVVWIDTNSTGGDSDTHFRSSNDSGNSFEDRKKLSRKNDILSSSPQIAATEKGNVYVVWIDTNSTSGDSDIHFRSSNNSGQNFSSGVTLTQNDVQTPLLSPQIAATENGNTYVVWFHNNVEFKEILGSGDILGRTILLSNNVTLSSSPQIAATENGNAYVVWAGKNTTSGGSVVILKRLSELFSHSNL
jgi:hypothetical protein